MSDREQQTGGAAADVRDRLLGAFAVPQYQMYVGDVDVPCGPGRFCARIRYDESGPGPVLNTLYRREEFALAMEEYAGFPLSDLALAAYGRRAMHCLGLGAVR